MKDRKYYTPDLSELHYGFEIEYNDLGWKPDIVDHLDLHVYDDNVREGLIRVKYLDREDIESLDWKYIPDRSMGDGQDRWYNLFCYKSFALFDGDSIIIRKECEIDTNRGLSKSEKEGQTIFQGTIKNKSELQKLMKQLLISK